MSLTVRNPLMRPCGTLANPGATTVMEAGAFCWTPRVNCAKHEHQPVVDGVK
jgi:hypothetical protein